jgi:hypothetical protein
MSTWRCISSNLNLSSSFYNICITLNTSRMFRVTSSAHAHHTKTPLPPSFTFPFSLPFPYCFLLLKGKITIFTRKSGFNGVSYVIKNNHTRVLHFTMDCSTGVNIVSHRGNLKHTQTILPGQAEVLHHIMPDSASKGWQSGYSASLEWI